MEIRKYFELIDKGNTMNQNFWNAIKAVLRGNVQLKTHRGPHRLSDLEPISKMEEQQKIKCKESRRKE